MKLTIPERIYVQEYIPAKGLYANMAEVRRVMDVIGFTSDELRDYSIQQAPDGSIIYDRDKSLLYVVDVPLTEWVTNAITSALIKREREGDLPITHITLYEKFVIDRSN